jgi:hypothetical protein
MDALAVASRSPKFHLIIADSNLLVRSIGGPREYLSLQAGPRVERWLEPLERGLLLTLKRFHAAVG